MKPEAHVSKQFVGLLIIAGIGYVLYLLMSQVILPLVGNIILFLVGVLCTYLVFFEEKKEVPDNRTLGEVAQEQLKKGSQEETLTFLTIGITGFLLFQLLATITIIRHAIDPTYQIFPINIMGIVATIGMIWGLFDIVKKIFTLKEQFARPFKKDSRTRLIIGKIGGVVVLAYIASIYLINFGIIR